MKSKIKITARERWVMAISPSVLIIAVYYFGIVGDLSANLEKEQKRLVTAQGPAPAEVAPTLAKAKGERELTKRSITEREAHIAQLEERIAAAPRSNLDEYGSAKVIEQVEAVFARNGVTPLKSEQADESSPNTPAALLDVLAPKSAEGATGRRDMHVWHCVFDGDTPRFQKAVKEIAEEAPAIVPVSFVLVYNPANSGESRLMELWMLY